MKFFLVLFLLNVDGSNSIFVGQKFENLAACEVALGIEDSTITSYIDRGIIVTFPDGSVARKDGYGLDCLEASGEDNDSDH